jgi:glycosyltransferase involved in cell wall biosynthesis
VKLVCDTGFLPGFRSDGPRSFSETFTEANPLRLLWVGRFHPRKGLRLAFDALAKTKAPIHLTLAGSGASKEAIDRLVAERGLTGRVHWSGARIPWMQVREAYATHDALLFTSLRDSFGSQNLEAMCLGLPILALNLSGVRDLVPPEAAIKVEIGDGAAPTAEALAAAMDGYAALPAAARNRMSEAAWRGAEDFSWAARIRHAIGLYRELAQAAPAVATRRSAA